MMTRQERAKQFAPFDAMKGLQEALRDREERHGRVSKREISEESEMNISYVLKKLCRGMSVQVTFYGSFHEEQARGYVTDISLLSGYLRVGERKILFEDIYDIGITDYNGLG